MPESDTPTEDVPVTRPPHQNRDEELITLAGFILAILFIASIVGALAFFLEAGE